MIVLYAWLKKHKEGNRQRSNKAKKAIYITIIKKVREGLA